MSDLRDFMSDFVQNFFLRRGIMASVKRERIPLSLKMMRRIMSC